MNDIFSWILGDEQASPFRANAHVYYNACITIFCKKKLRHLLYIRTDIRTLINNKNAVIRTAVK